MHYSGWWTCECHAKDRIRVKGNDVRQDHYKQTTNHGGFYPEIVVPDWKSGSIPEKMSHTIIAGKNESEKKRGRKTIRRMR